MPELLPRANERVQAQHRPSLVAATLAAVVMAVLGLLLCGLATVAAWVTDDVGSFADALRGGGIAWLMAHGSGVETADASISVVPLGSVALLAWVARLLIGSARGTHAVTGAADAVRLVVPFTLTYAVVAVIVVRFVDPIGAAPGVVRAALAAGAVALVGSAWGTLRGSAWLRTRRDALTPVQDAWLTAVSRGSALACMLMLTCGALLVTISLAANLGATVTVTDEMDAGVIGGLAVAVIGLVTVPNAAVAGGSYLAGPGFQVGTDTAVSPMGIDLGSTPLFPLFAALPQDGVPGLWQNVFLAVPIVIGIVVGVTQARRAPLTSWWSDLARPAVAGALGGVAFGLLSWLSSASLGSGRMSEIGPMVGATTLVVTASVTVGALVGAGVAYAWTGRASRQPRDREHSDLAPES